MVVVGGISPGGCLASAVVKRPDILGLLRHSRAQYGGRREGFPGHHCVGVEGISGWEAKSDAVVSDRRCVCLRCEVDLELGGGGEAAGRGRMSHLESVAPDTVTGRGTAQTLAQPDGAVEPGSWRNRRENTERCRRAGWDDVSAFLQQQCRAGFACESRRSRMNERIKNKQLERGGSRHKRLHDEELEWKCRSGSCNNLEPQNMGLPGGPVQRPRAAAQW